MRVICNCPAWFRQELSSLSNTVEQIRPVNDLTRLVRLVRSVQVVKQWFTSRTGRGTMVTCISLERQHFNLDSATRTTRTGRTGSDVQLVNTIDIYILMISNTVAHIRPVNGSRCIYTVFRPLFICTLYLYPVHTELSMFKSGLTKQG